MTQVDDCVFCQIVAGNIPGQVVYKDEMVTAFRDINPVAPTHILIVPNRHIVNNNAVTEADSSLIGHMFAIVPRLAKEEGIESSGYRLIMNNGPDANQVVFHLHLHLIGGQKMKYPMG